jgi:hypothetical protein
MLDGGQDDDTAAKVTAENMVRSRRLRDRFSSDDLQTMIDFCGSSMTAKKVAEKFGISLRGGQATASPPRVGRDVRSCRSWLGAG